MEEYIFHLICQYKYSSVTDFRELTVASWSRTSPHCGTQNSKLCLQKTSTCSYLQLDELHLRGVADKSLGRPGRKQATATKLGIFSTYCPRSSIHFLDHCSNFFKPLKKFRRLSVQPGLHGNKDLRVGRKMANFQLFFSPGNGW